MIDSADLSGDNKHRGDLGPREYYPGRHQKRLARDVCVWFTWLHG